MTRASLASIWRYAQVISIIALAIASPKVALAIRAIPEDNLAYPILITLDTGSQGSGFFLNTDNNVFLVTSKHVIFDQHGVLRGASATLLCYPRELYSEGAIIIDIDLLSVDKAGYLNKHKTHDVVIINIGDAISGEDRRMLRLKPGVIIKKKAGSGFVGVSYTSVTLFKDVLVSNQIILFGYPNSLGIRNAPQIDYEMPLLRSGIIAGVNLKKEYIILDCPVYQGNSGGPVLQVEQELGGYKGSVIGLISEFVPFAELWENKTNRYSNISLSNSGYSVVVPIDKVLELIER